MLPARHFVGIAIYRNATYEDETYKNMTYKSAI